MRRLAVCASASTAALELAQAPSPALRGWSAASACPTLGSGAGSSAASSASTNPAGRGGRTAGRSRVDARGAAEGGDEAGVALRRAGLAARERILDATCRVIVDKGMAAVRVGDIAREAGLSTALVHYHFATKDEVLLEAVVWQNARETVRRDAIVAGGAGS